MFFFLFSQAQIHNFIANFSTSPPQELQRDGE